MKHRLLDSSLLFLLIDELVCVALKAFDLPFIHRWALRRHINALASGEIIELALFSA